MSAKKLKSQDEFESSFKEMIKNIILEEEYIKKEEIKEIAKVIINELDPLIARKIKEHFVSISKHIVDMYEEKQT